MDNADVGSPREKMTWVWISGAAPYMGWGYFWSFLLLQDLFSSGVTLSFKSSKTNILKSHYSFTKIPRLFITTNLTSCKWLTKLKTQCSLMVGGWLWQSNHGGSFVSRGACSFMHTSIWSLNILQIFWASIVYIKQTGWSDHVSSNHLQWFKNNGKFCHPKSDCNHLWRVVIMRGSDYVRALTGRIWCFGSVRGVL